MTSERTFCSRRAANREDKMNQRLWLFLAIMLPVLAACAAQEALSPAPDAKPKAAAQGPGVALLEDGREGFVIREVPEMDDGSCREFERAVALLHDQEYRQAADLLEAVVERSPGVTAPYINLAIAYKHLERPEEAEAHLKTALAMVPGHPVAANAYGLLCRKAGRFEEARVIYEEALALFPDYYPVRRNLAILCDLYLNDPESALAHYELYSQARPEEAQVKLWIADLRNRLGHN
jgi:tetratricopeptide (TPR) repeat protein